MFRIAVFISGRGSNLQAILNSVSDYNKNVNIVAIFSNKTDCPAFEIARRNHIPTFTVSSKQKEDCILSSELPAKLNELNLDLIVLAGFLKKIPDEVVDQYPHKIINIHPALLPSYGGEGMYGMHVHKAVFDSSASVSGATVHFVDKIYDNGKIIAQRTVDISDVETPEEIAERVLKIEHELLPFVVNKFSEKKVQIKNNRVYLLN